MLTDILAGETAEDPAEGEAEEGEEENYAAGQVNEKGEVIDDDGNVIGKVGEGDAEKLAGHLVDEEGDILDEEGNVVGKALPVDEEGNVLENEAFTAAKEGAEEGAAEGAEGAQDAAEGAQDAAENAADAAEGAEGAAEGADAAAEGAEGAAEGAEGAAEEDEGPQKPQFQAPLRVQKENVVDATGAVIGKIIDGDPKKLAKREIVDIDEEGNLIDKKGRIVGQILLPGQEEDIDYSVLEGFKVNKAGNVVDEEGNLIGRLVEGEVRKCQGRECDEDGYVYSDSGKQIGRAEPVPEEEREEKPFEDFPGAVVQHDGSVVFNGQRVGTVVEGDPKKLEGKTVDADGEIADKNGNVIGRAERYEEPEEEQIEGPGMLKFCRRLSLTMLTLHQQTTLPSRVSSATRPETLSTTRVPLLVASSKVMSKTALVVLAMKLERSTTTAARSSAKVNLFPRRSARRARSSHLRTSLAVSSRRTVRSCSRDAKSVSSRRETQRSLRARLLTLMVTSRKFDLRKICFHKLIIPQ